MAGGQDVEMKTYMKFVFVFCVQLLTLCYPWAD